MNNLLVFVSVLLATQAKNYGLHSFLRQHYFLP